jgi:hypothetical protein
MPSGKTARRLVPFPKPTDAPQICLCFEDIANAVDNDVEGGQGTLAERPSAKLRGRVYMVEGDATAENNNVLWWDNGITWVRIGVRATLASTTEVERVGAFSVSSVRDAIVIARVEAVGVSAAMEAGIHRALPPVFIPHIIVPEIAAGKSAAGPILLPAGVEAQVLPLGAGAKAFTRHYYL